MTLSLFAVLVLYLLALGIACVGQDVFGRRVSPILPIAFALLFVWTCWARTIAYPPYSDLATYLVHYSDGAESYYGQGFLLLSGAVRAVIGANAALFIAAIATVNIVCILVAGRLLSPVIQSGAEETCVVPGGGTKQHWRGVGTLLGAYAMYWGLSYSAEVLRAGVATSLALLAIAFLLRRRLVSAILVGALALWVHWTLIILAPFCVALLFRRPFPLKRLHFGIWLGILLVADVLRAGVTIARSMSSAISDFLVAIDQSAHYGTYLDVGYDDSAYGYLSLQYFFYRVVAVAMLFADLRNARYRVFVTGFYIGLTIYTLFSGFDAANRLQWVYLTLTVFGAYYFVHEDRDVPHWQKMLVMSVFMSLQSVMALRYLGSV